MNFQAALLVTLVGIVASAPLSNKLDIMKEDTVELAQTLISKILYEIPKTHAAWINTKGLTLGDSKTRLQLEFLRKDMGIPSAPVLQNICDISNMEACLANITKGLKMHQNLLDEIINLTTLAQTKQFEDLKAEIQELLNLINVNQAGSDPSKQTPGHDLAKHLNTTNDYKAQVAAHLTLQQLQDFSCDILRSIRSMSPNMAENSSTVQLCVNAAGQ